MKSRLFFSALLVLTIKGSNLAVVPSPAATLSSCPSSCECSMHKVQCSGQGLSDIPYVQQGIELAVWLDVSDNNIELLSNNTFKQYPQLTTIDISKNEIETIELGAFHGVNYVQEVDLSENIIMYIHPDTFSENPNLEMVNLSGNPLMKLSINVPILNAPMITSLDLSFCQLTSLTPDMLKGMTELKSLDIKNNDITYFAYENVILLESLVEIKLDNNGWVCDDCSFLNVLHLLALRNPDANHVHEQVTCLDKNGDSKVMLQVLKELQSCKNEADDTTVKVIVTERDPDVYKGIWFHLQQHTFSLHTILIASIMLTIIIICTALCVTFVLKRSLAKDADSHNDEPQMKTKNLMQAFNEPVHKGGSLEPLLQLTSTPDDGPSSSPEWTTKDAERGPTTSLYHDFMMNRPNSEHIYDTIDYGRIIGV